MTSQDAKSIRTISVVDTQPVMVEGVRAVISGCPDLRLLTVSDSLDQQSILMQNTLADVLLIDKALGFHQIERFLGSTCLPTNTPVPESSSVVVWGLNVSELEAATLVRAGARGILHRSAPLPTLLSCLRSVAMRKHWIDSDCYASPVRNLRAKGSLTPREQEVANLVERGYKNGEIAKELGIVAGTVKVHLKHIFEKTGVRGRHAIALDELCNRCGASSQREAAAAKSSAS